MACPSCKQPTFIVNSFFQTENNGQDLYIIQQFGCNNNQCEMYYNKNKQIIDSKKTLQPHVNA